MNLGMAEMIFIILLALVLVGPRKLPEAGRQLGKFLAEFKRAGNKFRNQLETEMLNIELEERAKKQTEGPPGQPWERVMHPIVESVSRTKQDLAGIVFANPEPIKPVTASTTAIDRPASSARSALND